MLHAIMTMNSDQVFTIAGVMVMVALILSAGAALFNFSEHGDTLGCAALLAMSVKVAIFARMFPTPPDGVGSFAAYPVFDLIALVVIGSSYAAKPRLWKIALAFLFLGQLFAHGGFWVGRKYGHDNFPVYMLIVNLFAGLQKLVLAIVGAHGLAVGLGAWLHDRRSGRFPAFFREPYQ